jgi:hypothetical protein
MKKIILVCSFLFFTLSCVKDATQLIEDNRSPQAKEFDVGFLLEHEGCRLYRFFDAGYYHYYAKCHGSSEVSSQRSSTDADGNTATWTERTSTGNIEK